MDLNAIKNRLESDEQANLFNIQEEENHYFGNHQLVKK